MKKKILLGLTTVGAIIAPLAGVIACGKKEEQLGSLFEAKDVSFITDGGVLMDQSFNQSIWEGVKDSKAGENVNTQKPHKASEIINSYSAARTAGKKLFVAGGFNHESALKQFAPAHKGTGFVWIDGNAKMNNVASVQFNMRSIDFIAGIRMAYYASTTQGASHRIGIYGGMAIPSVKDYIDGIKEGITYFNAHRGSTAEVVIDDQGFVGDFSPGGLSTSKAAALVSAGDDLIMAVGGPQYKDVLTAIKADGENTTKRLVGVDVDLSKVVDNEDAKYFWGSVLKNLRSVTTKIVNDLIKNATSHLGKLYLADLDNGGTGLVVKGVIENAGNKYGIEQNMLASGTTPEDAIAAAKTFGSGK